MGKRLIITEEEKTYIRQSYGLVTEGLDKEKTATLRNNFLGKTINVYNDLQQQNLYGMLRIDGIVFRDPELNSGRVKMDLSDGVTTSQFEIHCLANPDRLSNEMDMYQGTTNKNQVPISLKQIQHQIQQRNYYDILLRTLTEMWGFFIIFVFIKYERFNKRNIKQLC
jgi:hypothetical protein